jgi:cellulose synthase/poly-beta-1,6-N-acetylglucosamine synthase-like glycosyltransferase
VAPPSVTVIVPVYNDPDRLRLLLAALAAQTWPKSDLEVLVVDNGSKEDVQTPVREMGPPFVALHEPKPGSYAARNKALAQACGEFVAFTDADTIPAIDWVERGVGALRAHPEAGLVAGRIQVFAAGRRRTWVERFEMLYAFPQERFVKEQHFGATANVFTRRSVLDRVGLFNAELMSGGDREWGQRVHAAGLPVLYTPDVVVLHPARRTFREYGDKIRRVVGGMKALDRDRAVMTPRMVPGHLVHITRKSWRRRPVHRAAGVSQGDAWRLSAVEWWFEWVRMRERLRLRRGGQARR